MFSLILSGGSIYTIPYLYQSYHSTMLKAFAINNTQLGFTNLLYGVFAMISYIPGGWLSDRISSRKLMASSLFTSSLLGFYLATFPAYPIVNIIHALMGITTILPFWAALIKSTRNWASADEQGRAFGILDGGRGVVEALVAYIALWLFAAYHNDILGLAMVINIYSELCLLSALSVWFFVSETRVVKDKPPVGIDSIRQVIKMPVVWLIALIVLCAYTASIASFNVTPFATQAFGLSAVFGATLSSFRMIFRPFASTGAGFLADSLGVAKTVIISFFILIGSFLAFSFMPVEKSWVTFLWINTGIVAFTVFALRGIYYALLAETGVPIVLTGTATGIISVIGYTPDAIIPFFKGMLLDAYPGELGHKIFFQISTGVVTLGFIVALFIYFKYVKSARK